MFLGSLTKDKGVMTILKGFEKADLTDYKLILAGSGPEEETLKAYINENNLSEKVILTGFVSGNKLEKLVKVGTEVAALHFRAR